MKTRFLFLYQRAIAGAVFFWIKLNLFANPTGMTVVSGTATAQPSGSQLTINAGNNATINWQSFNIAAGERTVFNQPSATSIVWNRINNQSASQIYGSLQANGIVVLLNSSGFYFGPNSFVSAAGLVVSTANCAPPQNAGGAWEFNGPPPLASIVNYGQIKIGNGGNCFLIADNIQNHGDIEAPEGNIGFAAGQTVTLSERPDGRGMSMDVLLPQGAVSNDGKIVADGGTIALNAKVVNQNGLIQADSIRDQNGVIELVASDSLNLGDGSQILAAGDNSATGSAGGNVTLKSGDTFSDAGGSQIITAGGANGGNGGNIEISAAQIESLDSTMDATAKNGFRGGEFLLDPVNIILGTSSANGMVNVNTAFAGFSTILLEAQQDITLADGTAWNLSNCTGRSSGQLILEAGRNIILGNTTSIYDFNNWSIALYAGVNIFSASTPTVQPGAGSIYLNAYDPNNPNNLPYDPSGFIQTSSGAITLVAGQDIIVGSGFVNTSGGGNINVHALAGNIDTGSYDQGYVFQSADQVSDAYYVDPSLGVGGISTSAGGDVNLTAGGNVTSLLPGNGGYYYDGNFISTGGTDGTAGSGAYGNQPGQAGNVTIVAGGDVTGHYLVANGVGSIFAGVQMDANGNPVKDSSGNYALGATGSAGNDSLNPNLALSLVSGGWNVSAAQNIILQEVNNPNGVFNVNAGGAYHYFDYSPDDYVNLSAGNLVQLGASSSALARMTTTDGIQVPIIYPSILNVNAGAGGVVLEGDSAFNQLILFPSPAGSLTITTTQGGSLVGALPTANGAPQIFNLIVSDSSHVQYNQSSAGLFGLNDHAATPIHLNDPTPIVLNISGDMDYVLLSAPEAAQINIGGNMNNSRFQGMNLSASDVTSINVAGDINNRSAFTSVDISQIAGAAAPNLAYLLQAVSSNPSATTLYSSFYYNPLTKVLTYQNIPGQSLANVLKLLENLTIQVTQNGIPQWADADDTIPVTTTVSVLNSSTAQALLSAYNAAGAIPSGAYGYTIGGGGKFEITAQNIDLGTTAGIQSKGVGFYTVGSSYPLARLFTAGADIFVNVTDDLTMYSSSIASLNGGNIYVNSVAGNINVGSSDFSVNTLGARGIYSTGQGNVAVYAANNIDVDGSRIAVYDVRPVNGSATLSPGGSVTVVSRDGNIDAGRGGSGFVVVSAYLVDPTTHAVTTTSPTIPGSGILSTSYADSGNMLVEAPNGSVDADAGGIVQLLLNNPVAQDTTLFGLPLNINTLAEMFRLELKNQGKAATSLENILNGNLGNSEVDVYAGYELQKLDGSGNPLVDSYGNPLITAENLSSGTLEKISDDQNINALSSGLISAGSLNVKASGTADVNFFALNNVNITANGDINAAGLGLGLVSVTSASGNISGTIAGIGGVSASGSSVDANLESNGAITGDTSGQKGLAIGTAANSISSAASASDDSAKDAKTDDATDELKKKRGGGISLAQKVSRVTVLLPKKD